MVTYILIATILYTIINLIIGFWNSRKINFESYVSNKSKTHILFVTLSIVATVVGGGMFFATGQIGYEAGIAGLSLPISYIIGFLILLKFIPKIRLLANLENCNTLYDVVNLNLKENKQWAKIYNYTLILINLIIYFFLLAGQFLILSTFYSYFVPSISDYSLPISLTIILISTLIYSIFGGIKKDIITDSFQMLCLFVGAVIIGLYLFNGSVFDSIKTLPTKYLNGTGYGILFPIGVVIFFSFSFIVRYDFWQRIITAKNDKQAKTSLIIAVPFIVFFYLIFTLLGMYSKSINPTLQDTNFATLFAFDCLIPASIQIIITLSLYAAIMSSADTFLNVSSYSLYKLIEKRLTVKNKLLKIRLLAFFTGIVSVLIVLINKDIVNLMVGAFSSLIIIVPSMIYVIFSKKPNGKITSIATIISFIIFLTFFFFIIGFDKYAFIIGTIISILIHLSYIVVKKLTK